MTLRLRCLRCGEWADLDPTDIDIGACLSCVSKYVRWMNAGQSYGRRAARWVRWQKNQERHPTFTALTAALDALESTPHGTLVEVE